MNLEKGVCDLYYLHSYAGYLISKPGEGGLPIPTYFRKCVILLKI